MNQREACVTIIEYVLEQAPDNPRVLRALKVLEKRAEALRLKHERHKNSRACIRCRRNTSTMLCWQCWHAIPESFRLMYDGASTVDAKREALRAVYEFIGTEAAA
ncbi:MAG: hypothetical protein P4L99_27975 [Chthoniobacter sp.]|nr:hypothetical protein [Chthoniobacter sp.]